MKPSYNRRGNMKHTGPYLLLTAMVLCLGTQVLAQAGGNDAGPLMHSIKWSTAAQIQLLP